MFNFNEIRNKIMKSTIEQLRETALEAVESMNDYLEELQDDKERVEQTLEEALEKIEKLEDELSLYEDKDRMLSEE